MQKLAAEKLRTEKPLETARAIHLLRRYSTKWLIVLRVTLHSSHDQKNRKVGPTPCNKDANRQQQISLLLGTNGKRKEDNEERRAIAEKRIGSTEVLLRILPNIE